MRFLAVILLLCVFFVLADSRAHRRGKSKKNEVGSLRQAKESEVESGPGHNGTISRKRSPGLRSSGHRSPRKSPGHSRRRSGGPSARHSRSKRPHSHSGRHSRSRSRGHSRSRSRGHSRSRKPHSRPRPHSHSHSRATTTEISSTASVPESTSQGLTSVSESTSQGLTSVTEITSQAPTIPIVSEPATALPVPI